MAKMYKAKCPGCGATLLFSKDKDTDEITIDVVVTKPPPKPKADDKKKDDDDAGDW